jgi:glycerol kinase
VIARDIERRGLRQRIEDLSSNRLDPYFCAAKYSWLLSKEPTLTKPGTELALGTLETWLLAQLSVEQATDIGTASRTQLTRLGGNSWDPELLELFGIPAEALAPIVPSLGDRGALRVPGMDEDLALTASLVDQPAALAGNGCIDPGTSKVTYGTGAFVVSNLGRDAPHGRGPLVASVGWGDSTGPVFIHDGGVFAAGSGLNWLASIGIDVSPAAQDQLIGRPPSGVTVSPALHGLGAPHWDRDAKAAILGMDASTTGRDILQAFLEAIAFRVAEILDASPIDDDVVRVDGGLTASTYLMQFQADVLGIPLGVGATPEATAVGSALLAGRAIGDLDDRSIRDATIPARIVEPTSTPVARERFAAWKSAVAAVN